VVFIVECTTIDDMSSEKYFKSDLAMVQDYFIISILSKNTYNMEYVYLSYKTR